MSFALFGRAVKRRLETMSPEGINNSVEMDGKRADQLVAWPDLTNLDIVGVCANKGISALVFYVAQQDFRDNRVDERRKWAALANAGPQIERVAGGAVELDATIRLIVKGGDEVKGSKDFGHVFLRDGGEGGGEVEEDACAVVLHERSVHGSHIDVNQVLKNRSSPEEPLLSG